MHTGTSFQPTLGHLLGQVYRRTLLPRYSLRHGMTDQLGLDQKTLEGGTLIRGTRALFPKADLMFVPLIRPSSALL